MGLKESFGKLVEKLKIDSSESDEEPGFKEKMVVKLLPVAENILPFFPTLKQELLQAEMEEKDEVRYLAQQLFQAISLSAYLLAGMAVIAILFDNMVILNYGAVLFPVVLIFGTFIFAKRPKAETNKRMREIEKDLPYAMRHILIEVEAGIPLYQAMVSVSSGYGKVSDEFKKIVSEINAGKDETKALENAILRNPSQKFRRGIWQLINAMRSGSDISTTLESLVDNLMDQQILEVEKYGEELNPYTLIYMLVAIIMPSLGVTFFMMISTFTGAEIANSTFYAILGGLAVFQVLFINMVASKRPQVKT